MRVHNSTRELIATQFAELRASLCLPVIAAPMFLVSGPDLVIAACRAGIVGAFPAPNARTPEILRDWLDVINLALANTRAVWAVNLVMHSSYARREHDLELVVAARPPLVITALGSPRDAIEAVHGYGGLVFADVNQVGLARKAVDAGADGLILVAAGAGGHTGTLAGFAFVDAVRQFFDGPLVLAGGVSTGHGIRAAEILGADMVSMGTTFIATQESLASAEYKSAVVSAGIEDVTCSTVVTGVPANWLAPSLRQAGYSNVSGNISTRPDFADPHSSAKAWKDVWSVGQGVAAVKAVVPVVDLVARLEREYCLACAHPVYPADQLLSPPAMRML